MVRKHLKRMYAPKTWAIQRKSIGKWITRPNSGPHNLQTSISLNSLLKEVLRLTQTTKESKNISTDSKIKVNGKLIQELKFPVGFMDIIEIAHSKFIILFNHKGRIVAVPTKLDLKPSKIVNKSWIKGKKLQLNLYDGTNLIIDKDNYKTGDSIFVKDKKIIKHIKFEKGATIFLTAGKHVGMFGKLEQEIETVGSEEPRILFSYGKEKYQTLKKYAFVVEDSMSSTEKIVEKVSEELETVPKETEKIIEKKPKKETKK